MRKFVYKFEISEEEWLSIHDRLDEAIRLLHNIDGICDDCLNIAISADDALSDLESSIHDCGFKNEEEPKMCEERIKLEMDMSDYGYIINALKIMQRKWWEYQLGIVHKELSVPWDDRVPDMSILTKMCLNILEKSNIEEPEEGIEMSEEEWNKIRNGAMQKTEEESDKPTSGRYEWKDNMPIYGPDPWKEINILKETIKTQSDMIGDIRGRIIPLTDMYNDHEDRLSELYEEVNNIKDLLKSYDNADRALNRRLLSIENQLGREFYDYKNKVALDIASINNRIHDYEDRLTAVEDRLDAKIVDMVHDNKNDISKLDARTNRLYELIDGDNNRITSLHIKLDNKIDILEERMNNLVKNVGRIENNVTNIEKDKKKLWDVVTGDDNSLDERFEGLKHTMECLIERDDCFFNKVKDLKNDMKELAQSNADKHNRLAMTVQNLKDFVEGKYDKDKLDISSASFNVYFDRNKKEDDDE